MHAPDLTLRPPRSPRVRLGGYVLLPRILDKCRAALAGKNGEYNYNCPLDRRFFEFVQLDAEAFKKQVEYGSGDGDMLAWVAEHSRIKPSITEILAWSAYQEQRVSGDLENVNSFTVFTKRLRRIEVTSAPGSICSTWMTSSALAAERRIVDLPDRAHARNIFAHALWL